MPKKKIKDGSAFKNIQQLAEPVQDSLKADLIIFGGSLYLYGSWQLAAEIRSKHKAQNALVMLTTFGGLADPAYRLARCLQQVYHDGSVILFVDTFCKSAGVVIATGADEIIMSDSAELGPLDAQVKKSDEIDERTSGLTAMQALSTLRTEAYLTFEQYLKELRKNTRIATRLAAELAEKLTVGLFTPIYSQMEPMRLGENERGMMIAREYGERLVRNTDNLKPKALEKLTSSYPSHEFVIDRIEAAELFNNVRKPSEQEAKLADAVGKVVAEHVFTDDLEKLPYTAIIPFEPKPIPAVGDANNDSISSGTDSGHGTPAPAPQGANGSAPPENVAQPNGLSAAVH
jgi:hypothetical protein